MILLGCYCPRPHNLLARWQFWWIVYIVAQFLESGWGTEGGKIVSHLQWKIWLRIGSGMSGDIRAALAAGTPSSCLEWTYQLRMRPCWVCSFDCAKIRAWPGGMAMRQWGHTGNRRIRPRTQLGLDSWRRGWYTVSVLRAGFYLFRRWIPNAYRPGDWNIGAIWLPKAHLEKPQERFVQKAEYGKKRCYSWSYGPAW